MKNFWALLLSLTALMVLSGLAQAQETKIKAEGGQPKILVLYFSMSGNTKAVAEHIHARVGGDLRFLEPEVPYSPEYAKLTERADGEHAANARPGVKPVSELDEYDVIFIGYPNWSSTMPMMFFTFFEQNPMAGKTLIPFCTHAGGKLGRSVEDIHDLCPNATILEGLSIYGSSAANSQSDVDAWLKRIGF